MNRQTIHFTVSEQSLTLASPMLVVSDVVNYIDAVFDLGENWGDFDSVRAIWYTDSACVATLLDAEGHCTVPQEVLASKAKVRVNLVGSVVENNVLTDRLTTAPICAINVWVDAKICGSESAPITPSQFEQFVAQVIGEVEKVTGMTAEAETLPSGSQATARYEDGVLTIGIPQGAKGEDGNGIASVVMNADYTLTINFTDGTSMTTASIRGAEGNGIRSIDKTGTSGLVDTYTITFDDGSTTTYTVTNGEKGDKGDTGLTPSFSIGTVETLEPTESATATITGTEENPVLNLGIPKGEKGEDAVIPWDSILPVDTASGAIASFPDGTDLVPAKSLLVTLDPIQSGSGTPSPDNVRPISGRTEVVTHRTGVNVWDEEWELGVFNTATGVNASSSTQIRTKNYIPVVADTNYYVKANPYVWVMFFDSDKNVITDGLPNTGGASANARGAGNQAVKMPTNCAYIRFYCQASYGNTYNNDISINYPSTDTDYHAYEGDTYTTSLGQTVYGGTLDVVSGELVVDRAMVDLGTLNWRAITASSSRTRFRSTDLEALAKKVTALSVVANAICSCFQAVSYSSANGGTSTGVFAIDTDADLSIWLEDTAYADATAFKTAMSGQTLVYELAQPQTIQLDPQTIDLLLGQNNVWSDGDVTITYNADIQRYIEKRTS